MFLHELLARSQVDQRLVESQLNAHAIRVIAARRARRQAERSACHQSMITRSGVASTPSLD